MNKTVTRAVLAKKLGSPTWTTQNLTSKQQARKLWQWTDKWTGNPLLIDFAAGLIRKLNIPPRNPRALARGFQRFIQQHIKFFREYPERFASPLRTIVWGLGDCDDQSCLLAALLRSFRIPARLVFVRLRAPEGHSVRHVFAQAFLDGHWVSLETVRPVPMGWDPIRQAKQKGIVVLDVETFGDKADSRSYA